MHRALKRVKHRPWPIPAGRWTWRQSWCDLLFAHWPVSKEELQPLMPEGLTIQEFDSTSWVGVVPFHMRGVMRRPLPDLPWISAFPELNLRLYVERDGKPGVWFLSLDATNPLAVWAARKFFFLPYFHSQIAMTDIDGVYQYNSLRNTNGTVVRFHCTYSPTSQPYEAEPGTLEHWLTARYCLYAQSPNGRLYRTEVHHHPWPLQKAEAQIEAIELGRPHGIDLSGPPSLLHFSKNIDVVVWNPETLGD